MKNNKSYFWLRFVSTAIDLSIIYCISIIFQFFIWKYTFIRFCDLFICVFFIYYLSSYILLKGKSPAKLLTGLKIVNSNGESINLKSILIRETAFKIAGNPSVGFDFKGSPFANDNWDGFFLNSSSLSYKDIFTGFIFYTPLNQQIKKTGYPNELDHFEDSLLRRAACVSNDQLQIAKMLIANYKKDPNYLVETEPAPYAVLLNGLNIILFPFLIILSYLLSLIFLLKKVRN